MVSVQACWALTAAMRAEAAAIFECTCMMEPVYCCVALEGEGVNRKECGVVEQMKNTMGWPWDSTYISLEVPSVSPFVGIPIY